MGACAVPGGIFDNYAMVQGIDHRSSRGRLRPRVPAPSGRAVVRRALLHKKIKGESLFDHVPRRETSRSTARPATPPRADRRNLGAVGNSVHQFRFVVNPTVDALRGDLRNASAAASGRAVTRSSTSRASPASIAMAWLRDAPQRATTTWWTSTAVEVPRRERPLEVVYQLRSLGPPRRPAVKSRARPGGVSSRRLRRAVVAGADWLDARRTTCSASLPGPPRPARISCGRPTPKLPAAEDFPCGAASAAPSRCGSAGRQPRSALLHGGAVDRRGVRRAPRRHEEGRLRRGERGKLPTRMSKRTSSSSSRLPGLDARVSRSASARRGARRGRDRSCPAGAGPRGRAHADQHRAPASGDPRRLRLVVELDGETWCGCPPPRLSPLGLRKLGEYRHTTRSSAYGPTDYLSPSKTSASRSPGEAHGHRDSRRAARCCG